MIYKLTNTMCSDCGIVMCIRMTWSMPAAVPQTMLCLIKLMKHRVIWSLLLSCRHSTWLGKHLNISMLVNSVKTALISYNLKFVCISFLHAVVKEVLTLQADRLVFTGRSEWLYDGCGKDASLSRKYIACCTLCGRHIRIYVKHLNTWHCCQLVFI